MKTTTFQKVSFVLLVVSILFFVWALSGGGNFYEMLENRFNDGDGDGDGVLNLAFPILWGSIILTIVSTWLARRVKFTESN